MKFANVGGITLHYSLEGVKEGVPLVFINSLGSDYRIWDGLISYFAGHFQIIRYDKRGHGLSDCPPGPYTIRDHSDDLAGLLRRLSIEQVILIGVSIGGMIALDQAIRRPQSVKALVLSDTAARIGTPDFWQERIKAIRENGLEDMAETILARWFAESFSRQYPAEYRGYHNMLTRMPVAGYLAACAGLADADLREPAKLIKAKALVLCGAEDLATPPELGRELAETLGEARFEVIEEAGHLPCVEQPAAMAEKINRFFRENGYV